MRCLIIDHVSPRIEPALKEYGIEVDYKILPTTQELMEIIEPYDLLVMRVDPFIDKKMLDACKNLKAICVCAAGLNHIDVKYAEEKGLSVFSAPGVNYNAVAELTILKMLDLSRRTTAANEEVKVRKVWDKYKWVGSELRGKTLGIAGFGKIGRRVAELAQAFGMTVVAYDPYVTAEQGAAQGVEMLSIDELLRRSDFISKHVPLTAETKNLISFPQLEQMKDGAMIISMGRGGILDEEAAYHGLKSGKLGGVSVDVMSAELSTGGLTDSAGFDSPLFELDNFIVSPHIGGSTFEAIDEIGELIVSKVAEKFGLGG